MGNATTIVGSNEMALPAFMECVDGLDFVTDTMSRPIAEGGGGIVRHAIFQNYNIGIQYLGTPLEKCVVKEIKGTLATVFQ